MAAAAGEGLAGLAGAAVEGGGVAGAAPEQGRERLFGLVVDAFLDRMYEAGSYRRFAACYSRIYKVQPELTRCIYDQFLGRLQDSFREEIQELKQEGNLEALFGTLDKLVDEAKDRETPAWRPSGVPEEDVRSAIVPYLLKQHRFLQKSLKEKEAVNARLAETVMGGRKRITDLQEEVQKRRAAWQAVAQEGREIAETLEELQ